MDKESKLAEKEGRPDPIHSCWEDTNVRWIRVHRQTKRKTNTQKNNKTEFSPHLFLVNLNLDQCFKKEELVYDGMKAALRSLEKHT